MSVEWSSYYEEVSLKLYAVLSECKLRFESLNEILKKDKELFAKFQRALAEYIEAILFYERIARYTFFIMHKTQRKKTDFAPLMIEHLVGAYSKGANRGRLRFDVLVYDHEPDDLIPLIYASFCNLLIDKIRKILKEDGVASPDEVYTDGHKKYDVPSKDNTEDTVINMMLLATIGNILRSKLNNPKQLLLYIASLDTSSYVKGNSSFDAKRFLEDYKRDPEMVKDNVAEILMRFFNYSEHEIETIFGDGYAEYVYGSAQNASQLLYKAKDRITPELEKLR